MPKYLWKLYERLSKEDEKSDDPNHNENSISEEYDGITGEKARIIEMSDTIMTFYSNRK